MQMRNLRVVKYPPGDCSYKPDETRQMVWIDVLTASNRPLNPIDNPNHAEDLRREKFRMLEHGFISSHFYAATTMCESCRACVNLRVNTSKFYTTKSQRHLSAVNADVTMHISEPNKPGSPEISDLYELYTNYLKQRHPTSHMNNVSLEDFKRKIAPYTHILTLRDRNGILLSCAGIEVEGTEMVLDYIFYNAEESKVRSLGKLTWLRVLENAQRAGIEHVYIASWVSGGISMDYKKGFKGLEAYTDEDWVDFDPEIHTTSPDYKKILGSLGFRMVD